MYRNDVFICLLFLWSPIFHLLPLFEWCTGITYINLESVSNNEIYILDNIYIHSILRMCVYMCIHKLYGQL